ncbi:hypothetical protein C8J56DRAFT_1040597 [Mycena floridula]|nr:hypothetical protein C8J56DRAFT_1040597 [Mycena floridula]
MTSSISALFEMLSEPKVIEQLGKDAAAAFKYFASKTLAEKAAWSFYEEHKSKVSWELAVLCPGWRKKPLGENGAYKRVLVAGLVNIANERPSSVISPRISKAAPGTLDAFDEVGYFESQSHSGNDEISRYD